MNLVRPRPDSLQTARQNLAAGPGPSSILTGWSTNVRAARTKASAGGIGGFFRQLQGGLPVVGLLSKLFSPTGLGLEDMNYPEFSRSIYDTNSADFRAAARTLEERHGRPAQLRYLLLILWMARLGGGLVPASHIPKAAQRLRVSYDIEIEIERFQVARAAKLEEFGMARPQPKQQEQLCIAMDSLCRLAPGLADGQRLSADDEPLLISVVACGFNDIPEAIELARGAAASRESRGNAYL